LGRFLWVLPALLCIAVQIQADALDDVRQRGVLRWGGDEEGGAPYIISSNDAKTPAGFEGELMQALAQRLGVRSEFQQCQWDNLGDLLRSGGVDVIVNGIELRADRLRSNISTIPYYVNDLQLLARANDKRLTGWSDLKQGKWRIGVLSDTAAEKYLVEVYPQTVKTESYPGTTQAMDHVRDQQLDATLTDLIAANTYRDRYPTLHFVGEPVGRGYFVIYLRSDDARLRDELNAGIRDMLADGRLQAIYEKYKIWNEAQRTLGDPDVQSTPERMKPADAGSRGIRVILRNLLVLGESATVTVLLSVLSMPLAILIGLLVALGRLYGPAILRVPLTIYVEVIRGTPLMLQLFVLFYVIPSLIPMPDDLKRNFAWICAIAGLAINYSAYEAEIYRAGLLAIPVGQMEAALALGMTRRQTLLRIIVPQAVRIVIPAVTNDFIALFKDTSVCSAITIIELSKRYSIVANNTGRPLEIALATAILYMLMSYPLSLLARRLEKHTKRVHV